MNMVGVKGSGEDTVTILSRGSKAKYKAKFYKIAIEDAKRFKQIMRNLSTDIYACIVSFIG